MSIMNKGKRTVAAAMGVATAGAIAMSVAFVPTASAAPLRHAAGTSVVSVVQATCYHTTALQASPGGAVVGVILPGDNYVVLGRYGDWLNVYDYTIHMSGFILISACGI